MKKLLPLFLFFAINYGCEPTNPTPPANQSLTTTFYFTVNGRNDSIIGSLTNNNTSGSVIKKETYSSGSSSTTRYPRYIFESKRISTSGNEEYYITFGFCPQETLNAGIYKYDYNTRLVFPYPNGWGRTWECRFPYLNIQGYYGSLTSSDQTEIVITNIHDGYADGTYTSYISNAGASCSGCTPVTVSNGIFKNVKILN
jgi:hypothetical protein